MKINIITTLLLVSVSFLKAADNAEKLEPRGGNSGGGITTEAASDLFPYKIGDVIGYTTANSALATQKAAKIVSIKGKWIKVDGRAGNRNFNCWVNTDNLVEVWRE